MRLTRLVVQTSGVLALVILVGWPRFQRVPTVTVWRADGPLAPRPELVDDDARVRAAQDAARVRAEREPRADGTTSAIGSEAQSGLPWDEEPDTLSAVGARSNAIVGRARTVSNRAVAFGRVVLRNTRTGFIEARATADKSGRFRFVDVLPSAYVVELVSEDGTVIASSAQVSVGRGDLGHATVRVASNSMVRAVFGGIVQTPTVDEAINRAAASGARTMSEPTSVISPQ